MQQQHNRNEQCTIWALVSLISFWLTIVGISCKLFKETPLLIFVCIVVNIFTAANESSSE